MKKILKRTMSAILVLSIIMTLLMGMTTVTMAAESTGNFLWIESANMVRDGGGHGTISGTAASGGTAVVVWDTQAGLTANFTVDEGTYDIWFLGQKVAAWASTLNWQIDGGESQGKYAISNYAEVGTVSDSYPANCWHKLNSQVYFTAGSHSVRIGAVAKSTSTNKFIQLYDAVVIVPSELLWKPSGLTKPTKGQIAGGYTYIEGANFTYADRHSMASQTGADRGTVAKFYNSSDAEFVSAKINYDFMVDETAEYDIWVMGSQSVAWLGEYKWKLDDGESYNGFGTALRHPYDWTVQGGAQPVYVYRVGIGETITAGKHNIEFELKKRTAGNGSFNLIDTIMVVPTNAKWTWKLGDGITAAMLSLDKATLSIDNQNEIREDFTLPILGQSGSKISWTSSNNEVISIDGGKCTLKESRKNDESATLTATITRDGSSVTKSFYVTVKKNVSGYVIDFENGFTGETINATAVYHPVADEIAEFEGVIALYDKSGRLLNVSSNKSENNIARISIPNQKDVYSAKVFVWNSISGLYPLTKPRELYNLDEYVDFAVTVEEGREAVVLQLTDTQIIDAAQERTESRLGTTQEEYWATDKMNERCFGYIRETIEATNPDLILITGDLVYGEFDDKGTSLTALIDFMESFDIPWAPVFGNHDNESTKGADWQCQQLENAKNCLFKQRTLTGNGNYSIGIVQGGKLKRVFFMLDSNGCGAMSDESIANGHSQKSRGFGSDQIAWYTESAQKINNSYPDMKYTFAFHIQPQIFKTAYEKYGFTNSGTANNPINIDKLANAAETDFGYIGSDLKGAWDTDFAIYNGMKDLGADSILVGHEHANSASVVYDGVRFQYGQKSSTYDRANYIKADGTIVTSYADEGEPIMGGTVMKLSETDGAITDAYIYYCDSES